MPTEFYNGGTAWAHHWSEYLDANDRGAGVMFRNLTNRRLYAFDAFAGAATGTLEIFNSTQTVELNPVTRFPVEAFQDAYNIAWFGAVATFGTGNPADTIYSSADGYTYDGAVIY